MSGWAVGIDVGGTKMLAVAVPVAWAAPGPSDDEGRAAAVVDLPRRQVPTERDPDGLVDVAARLVEALADDLDDEVVAVGLGLPGFIDRRGIARQAPNLPHIVDHDLAGPLSDRLGRPVVVDNDANCAAWAAARLDAPSVGTVVAVTLGTGIGGGIVIDGGLVRGAHGFAGEPGHMVVDPDGPRCVCGQRGCWEVWASGSGLGRLAAAAVADGSAPGLGRRFPDGPTGPDVMRLAASGDPEAVAVRRRFAWWVALGLVNLVNLLDPGVVILSGGIVAEGDELLVAVREAFDAFPTTGPGRRLDLRISRIGPAAGAVGAALLAAGKDAGRPEPSR